MAKIMEIREIPLSALVIGESQARMRRIDAGIDELATSIRVHGLLEPILVCQSSEIDDTFEVLTGQRRVLAHERLGRNSILAAIIDNPVDMEDAKAISLTENIVRRDLDAKDVIDACTTLYKKYGSARAVADETGIPYAQVLKHLKYDRIHPELRHRVDSGEIDLNVALKAQDTVTDESGNVDSNEAIDLAEALSTMTGPERRQILRKKRASPNDSIKDIVCKFWEENEKDRQVVVTLPAGMHRVLQGYAKNLRITQDEAAARIICGTLKECRPSEIA